MSDPEVHLSFQVRRLANCSPSCAVLPLDSLRRFNVTTAGGSVGALTRMGWSSTEPDRADLVHAVGGHSLTLTLHRLMGSILKVTFDPQVLGAVSLERGSSSMPTCLIHLLSVTATVASFLSSVPSSIPRTRVSWTSCIFSIGESPETSSECHCCCVTSLTLCPFLTRFPEAFNTFSSFRKVFPSVSSYCFCSDSRGREMHNTGEHFYPRRALLRL